MNIYKKLIKKFENKSRRVTLKRLTIGLSYTAVSLANGDSGVAMNFARYSGCCKYLKEMENPVEKPASEIIQLSEHKHPLIRSIGIAAINAMNNDFAKALPTDRDHLSFEKAGIRKGSKVCMAGYFKPIIKMFQDREVSVYAFDITKEIGDKETFEEKLNNWADVFLLTSTSIVNETFADTIKLIPENIKTIMLGPTTILTPDIFSRTPVDILAGIQVKDSAKVHDAISHGKGTRGFIKYCRKIYALSG